MRASGPLRRLDAPGAVVALVGLLYLVFIGLRLAQHGFDPSYFVTGGDRLSDPTLVPPDLQVRPNSAGYDGQFYYRLALDPFTNRQTAYGITLDYPAYRQQRIVYPLLVRLVSLGRFEWVPTALIGVNYLALLAIAAQSARLARGCGRHALWGLLVALWPGFLFSLSRDLAEIVGGGLLLAGVLALRRVRPGGSAALLSLAVVARETTLLFGPLAGLEGLVRPGPVGCRLRRLVLLAPLGCWLAWQAWLLGRWGTLPFQAGSGNLGPPGVALVAFVGQLLALDTRPKQAYFAELCLLAVLATCAALALRRSRSGRPEKLAWGAYLLFAICLSSLVWVENWSYMRALTELGLFGGLIVLGSPSLRLRAAALAATVLLWLVSAAAILNTI